MKKMPLGKVRGRKTSERKKEKFNEMKIPIKINH